MMVAFSILAQIPDVLSNIYVKIYGKSTGLRTHSVFNFTASGFACYKMCLSACTMHVRVAQSEKGKSGKQVRKKKGTLHDTIFMRCMKVKTSGCAVIVEDVLIKTFCEGFGKVIASEVPTAPSVIKTQKD